MTERAGRLEKGSGTGEVTRLLKRWNDAGAKDRDRLLEFIYHDLWRIAGRMHKNRGHIRLPVFMHPFNRWYPNLQLDAETGGSHRQELAA